MKGGAGAVVEMGDFDAADGVPPDPPTAEGGGAPPDPVAAAMVRLTWDYKH